MHETLTMALRQQDCERALLRQVLVLGAMLLLSMVFNSLPLFLLCGMVAWAWLVLRLTQPGLMRRQQVRRIGSELQVGHRRYPLVGLRSVESQWFGPTTFEPTVKDVRARARTMAWENGRRSLFWFESQADAERFETLVLAHRQRRPLPQVRTWPHPG